MHMRLGIEPIAHIMAVQGAVLLVDAEGGESHLIMRICAA
jgi:hypothetical protein